MFFKFLLNSLLLLRQLVELFLGLLALVLFLGAQLARPIQLYDGLAGFGVGTSAEIFFDTCDVKVVLFSDLK